jgi:predicted membrane protein
MRMTGRVWWGVLLIVLGILFILDEHTKIHVSELLVSLWPLALVGVGTYLLVRARRPVDESAMVTAPLADVGIGRRVVETTSSSIRVANIFGDVRSRVHARDFTGGTLSTVMGIVTADLTRAALAPGEQSLKVDSVMGSVIVRLPRGMAYSVTADGVVGTVRMAAAIRNGVFPSVHHVSEGYREAACRIHLDLSTVFGEVRVEMDAEHA